jgi:hypothetical protein
MVETTVRQRDKTLKPVRFCTMVTKSGYFGINAHRLNV